MDEFFEKIKRGKKKVEKFEEEERRFRRVTPLPIMLLNDALPLMVAVAYVLIGVLGSLWHPGWLIFLLIPTYYLIIECVKHKSAAAFPIALVVTGVYLCLGFIAGLWHPYWVLFFIIPIYYMIVAAIKGGSWAKVFDLLVPALTVAGFLLVGFLANAWHPGWVIFFAIPLYYEFKSTVKKYRWQKKAQENGTTYQISADDIEDKDDD
ncbi:MAG: hypothetical protein IJ735_02195 [Clostridia bacterium]|nr:hypothetical protein [Clostridia bacterium]